MAGKKRNSSFEILTAMQDLNTPAGALQLAQILHLPSASIGRELLELEKAGLLVKVQNKGRILTPQGERFLEDIGADKIAIPVGFRPHPVRERE